MQSQKGREMTKNSGVSDRIALVGAILDASTEHHTGRVLGAVAAESIAADVLKQLHDYGYELRQSVEVVPDPPDFELPWA